MISWCCDEKVNEQEKCLKNWWAIIFAGMLLVSLSGCLPTSDKSGRSSSTSSTDESEAQTDSTPQADEDSTNSSDTTNNSGSDNELYWYTTTAIPSTITVDMDITSAIYLRGSRVENLLNVNQNHARIFCMAINWSGFTRDQMRARAVPIIINNLATGSTERLLRIDIHDSSANQATCNNATNTVTMDGVAFANSAFQLVDVCPTCSGVINATNVKLFISDTSTTATELTEAALSLNSLGFNIDTNSNVTNPSSSCTNASCQGQGFSCCLDGQCVNEGAVRPNTDTSAAEYLQSVQDIAQNPLSYLNYPQYYYICEGGVLPTPTAEPTPDAQATAAAEVAADLEDYYCYVLDTTQGGNPGDGCQAPLTTAQAQENILSKCGCATPTVPANCPGITLSLVQENGVDVGVQCVYPTPQTDPTPFQNLSLSLNNRTTPHLLFKASDGTFVRDITTFSAITPAETPEGTPFSYIDPSFRSIPDTTSFNMNALIGYFDLSGLQARPAHQIDIEVGRSYIISVLSGGYIPCSSCARDSWFNSFTAHPTSRDGRGVQPVGYTTRRDIYSNNTSNGNYEDMIFGRACFIPPTMIPFSHSGESTETLPTQRLNRLATQAAYYVNGYQRDWWGFNYGAVIGSFDGVSWFAVGQGRRITADTNKLFLAYNAPFGDLAEVGNHIISIIEDSGTDVAASYDYDPNLLETDPRQNQGATCQRYHQCDNDVDCITQLGWEYMCADANRYQSRWPRFDVDANEYAGQSLSANFNQILHFPLDVWPSGSRKRCVYRGAGAPCKTDFSSLELRDRKLFACAPNFFCETIDTSPGFFNHEVARFATQLSEAGISSSEAIHLYGQEANHLGRPRHYLGDDAVFSSAIQSNMTMNSGIYVNDDTSAFETSQLGVCRPGRYAGDASDATGLSGDPIDDWHKTPDQSDRLSSRTDYVSQISGCQSSSQDNQRVMTCPIIDMDSDSDYYLDYAFTTSWSVGTPGNIYSSTSFTERMAAVQQNSCGAESLSTAGENPFSSIEHTDLTSSTGLQVEAVVQNACLRRAGAVCHTDLDCSPNRLHAGEVALSLDDRFGNTLAERKYWEEALVCSQAERPPGIFDNNYLTYDLSLNRCCREVGGTLTMYGINTYEGVASTVLDPGAENSSLNPQLLAVNDVDLVGRYSRYTILGSRFMNTAPIAGSTGAGTQASPAVTPTPGSPGTFQVPGRVMDNSDMSNSPVPVAFQWSTFHETGKRSCCGGGWIRKFADGGHDWTVQNRLNIDPTDFKCLNYSSELYKSNILASSPDSNYNTLDQRYGEDLSLFCSDTDGITGSCIQRRFSNSFNTKTPPQRILCDSDLNSPTTRGFVDGTTAGGWAMTNSYQPHYTPGPNSPFLVQAADSAAQTSFGADSVAADGSIITGNDVVRIKLPAYVVGNFPAAAALDAGAATDTTDTNFWAPWYDDQGTNDQPGFVTDNYPIACRRIDDAGRDTLLTENQNTPPMTANAARCNVDNNDSANTPNSCCKYHYNETTGEVHVFRLVDRGNNDLGEAGGVRISYTKADCNGDYNTQDGIYAQGSLPGNDFFYLDKLGRFELLGIPQVLLEPVFCNSNYEEMVPNLFQNNDTSVDVGTTTEFANLRSFLYPNNELLDAGAVVGMDGSTVIPYNQSGNVTTYEHAKNQAIFSPDQFVCCSKLGSTVEQAGQCCSSFAVDDGSGGLVCKLPSATDLDVYFNRFVSGEGAYDSDNPGAGGLEDSDFDPRTGEPLQTIAVRQKIGALGIEHCQSGAVTNGASLGSFRGEPLGAGGTNLGNPIYSFVDSFFDNGVGLAGQQAGLGQFNAGFRWTHHIYCQ